MTMKFRHYVTCGVAIGALACGGKEDERQPVADADLVSASGSFSPTSGKLDVAVSPRDASGRFVGEELEADAFSFEGVTIAPQNSSTLTPIEMSVSGIDVYKPDEGKGLIGVVVFDSSGSMSSNDPGAVGRKAGGEAIIDTLRPNDQLAIVDFGAAIDSGLQASRVLQDFTSDAKKLDAALDSLTESGDTPLYTSLLDALSLLEKKTSAPSVIVVLTDGQASDSGLSTVIARAKAQDVQVYAVGLGTSLSFVELTELGRQTGGGAITAAGAEELRERFSGIGLGVSTGRVIVRGSGTYPALSTGVPIYEVSGTLVTSDPLGDPIRTPFQFVTSLTP